MTIDSSDIKRFISKVDFTTDCWEWTASVDGGGYGQFSVNSKPIKAHRFSWIMHHGDIPINKNICHHCDNPKCVNPSHLFIGTQADNVDNMVTKGRHGNSKLFTRCKIGNLMRRDRINEAWLAQQISLGLDNPVSSQLISDWSNGRGTPSHGYVLRMIKATGWNYEEIFEEE